MNVALWQEVDVGTYGPRVDGGAQAFAFAGFVRTFEESPADVAQVVVEYRDAAGQVLDRFDSGQISSVGAWQRLEDVRPAPVGTRALRVRLLATRFTGIDNDAYFDALSLRSLRTAALTVGDVEVAEGDSGTRDAAFAVSLSCAVDGTVTLVYATADGAAGLPAAVVIEDYLAVSGQLTFEPGVVALEVAVPVVGDQVHEPHEVFHLDVAPVSSAPLVVPVDPRGDGRILNDDFCPLSPGFWKNHTEVWPVDYLELGGVEHGVAELLELLEYNGPDAASKLARQLVATKLNLAVGSDPVIVPVVDEADLFLVDFPPGSNPRGEDRQRADALKDELDAYNNLDCEEVPVIPASSVVLAGSGVPPPRARGTPREVGVAVPLDRPGDEEGER